MSGCLPISNALSNHCDVMRRPPTDVQRDVGAECDVSTRSPEDELCGGELYGERPRWPRADERHRNDRLGQHVSELHLPVRPHRFAVA